MSSGITLSLREPVKDLTLTAINRSSNVIVLVKSMVIELVGITTFKVENIKFSMGYTTTSGLCSIVFSGVHFESHNVHFQLSTFAYIKNSTFNNSLLWFWNEIALSKCDGLVHFSTLKMKNIQMTGLKSELRLELTIMFMPFTVTMDNLIISNIKIFTIFSRSPSAAAKWVNCPRITSQKIPVNCTDFQIKRQSITIAIENCSISKTSLHIHSRTQNAILKRVNFTNCLKTGTALLLLGPMNIVINDCNFDHNEIRTSTMILYKVNLSFFGYTRYSNNIANIGGAISMTNSTIWLGPNSNVSFINNTALSKGGAIFVSETNYWKLADIMHKDSLSECFYQFLAFPLNSTLYFKNNTATGGGNDIYGSGLNSSSCYQSNSESSENQTTNSSTVVRVHTQTLSSISSNPKKVCLCENGKPRCSTYNYIYHNMSIVPGERFKLSLVLVGSDFGTVAGSVYISSTNYSVPNDFSFLAGDKLIQLTNISMCTDFEYRIQALQYANKIQFILNRYIGTTSEYKSDLGLLEAAKLNSSIKKFEDSYIIDNYLQYFPVIVSVDLLPCPLGFTEKHLTSNIHYVCKCNSQLRTQYASRCELKNNTGRVYRNSTIWIGTVGTNTLLAHKICPFDYCDPDSVGVDLNHPDSQCALNHSGVLCGGCPPGLSLAIGSSRCLDCPNNNSAALLLVFIVAGIAMVLFIKVFDLTVTHGTLNGIVFYVNNVWINEAVFFTSATASDHIHPVFLYWFLGMKGFISLFNLDFGIETCFIKGLDAYWKTWLQFVFPFYIWILAGLIVMGCHYSTRITKHFGTNAVSVLTTMFSVSYTKLLRVIVTVLGPAVLQQYHPEGTRWVWLLDGNVSYLGLRHTFLFIMAVFVLLCLCLPYTVTLLFMGPLQRIPCKSLNRVIFKIKPLLDTFTGPLKSKHFYWVGLNLLVRSILAVTASIFQGVNQSVNIALLLTVTVLLCMLTPHVYKECKIAFLHLSVLLNLIALCIAFLSTEEPQDAQKRMICICLSVGAILVTFTGLVIYQAYTIYIQKHLTSRFQICCINNNAEHESEDEHEIPIVAKQQVVTTTSIELREALL